MKNNALDSYLSSFEEDLRGPLLEISTLVACTAYLPNVVFQYGHKYESLSYMAVYFGPSGTGKSLIDKSQNILEPLFDHIPEELIAVSADNTDANLMERLYEAKGRPLIILESEVKELLASEKSKYGKRIRGKLLKIAAFEKVSVERKGEKKVDRRNYIIRNPRLSIMMTGTPEDLETMELHRGDGFASRLHIMISDLDVGFRSQRPARKAETYVNSGKELGNHLLKAWEYLEKLDENFEVQFTSSQWDKTTEFGEHAKDYGLDDSNDNIRSQVRRGMQRVHKLAGIITLINRADALSGQSIECDDESFDKAFNMVVKDLIAISPRMAISRNNDSLNKSETLQIAISVLDHLGPEFTTADFKSMIRKQGLSERTAMRLLDDLRCLNPSPISRSGHGKYRKLIEHKAKAS